MPALPRQWSSAVGALGAISELGKWTPIGMKEPPTEATLKLQTNAGSESPCVLEGANDARRLSPTD